MGRRQARGDMSRIGQIALAALLIHLLSAVAHAQAGGTPLVNEKFEGAVVTDPNFGSQGRTCLTGASSAPPPGAANVPPCPVSQNGPVPPRGGLPGYLQFTDVANNIAGSILYNRPIPSSAGVVATFDQWQYAGSGADGIAFFLVDGATTLTTTGGLGGSLGYAQRNSEPGVVQGYLGIGFDAFGNFYNDGENRGNGCAMKPPNLHNPNQLVPDVVTLRGPGNGLTGYCWLGSTTTNTVPPTSALGGSLRAATLAAGRRTISLTITPAPTPRVMVSIDFYDGRGSVQFLNIPAPPNPPATYKFGWSGSTGGSTDIHLIRNVVVKTVNPLNQLNLVKQIDRTNPLPDPIVVGSVIPYQFTVTNSGLETLTGLTVTDPLVGSLTCPTDRIDPAPAPTSTVVCRGSHVVTQADLDAGQLVNTAVATGTAPGPSTVTSNPSSVTIPLGTTPRVAIQKFVDTPGPYVVGQTIAYRYNVSNTGTVTLTDPAVTDDKGFAVTCVPPTTLKPGNVFDSSTTCTGQYTLALADINPTTGILTNTATASAQPPTGARIVSTPASQSIPVGVDIAVTKTVDQPAPHLNDIVTFTVTATNQGPGAASGVTLSDPIGAGVAFSSATATAGTSYNQATGGWTIGNLAANQSVTLQLRLQVTSVLSPYTNTASLATVNQPDINPANNSAQATITPVRDADVGMAKTVDNPMPSVGQQVVFTVTASNAGPSPASGVIVSDLLPAGLTFVAATPSQGSYVNTTGVWTVGSIPVNQSAILAITARVTQTGTITNTTTKTAQNEPDPNPSNNTASVSLTADRRADLTIGKNDGLTTVAAGAPVTYRIAVSNLGPADVVGASVVDTFPAALPNATWTCAPAAGSGGACGAASGTGNISTTVDLAVGQSVVFEVTGTVAPDATGTLSNTATVMPPAGTTDPDTGNNTSTDTTTIAPSADLAITKTGPADPIVVRGTPVTFTLNVTNRGPSTATAVMVDDPAPAGLTLVQPVPGCPNAFPCDLGTLAPGDTRTLTVTFDIPSNYPAFLTVITNVATVTSPVPDPNPANNTGQASVTLGTDIADLNVTKSNGVPPGAIVAGTQTTYTMVVTNNGPSDVAGAMVVDTVPAELTGVTWTCTPNGTASCTDVSGTGSINTTVTIAASQSVTFTLTGTVAPDARGQLVNTITATVPPRTADPTPNSATDTDPITALADVSIVKTGPPVVVPGNQVAYQLQVVNSGPSTAVAVVVNDVPPSGLTFVSTSGACSSAFPCALGDIPPDGVPRTITATYAVPLGYMMPNPIPNTAVAGSATMDPDPSNNTSTAQTPVNTSADVAVTKTVTPLVARLGDTVTFTVTATNLGPNRASGVVITDVLPAGLSLATASPSQGTYDPSLGEWTIGSLLNGASATLALVAQVAQPAQITNVAAKTAQNEFDPNTGNDVATATISPPSGAPTAAADLAIRKTVDNPTPPAGSIVVFTVNATNQGPDPASGVVVNDLLPAGLSFLSAAPSPGTTYDSATGDWTIGGVALNQTLTLAITARVDVATPIVNVARKTAQTEADPNPFNDRDGAVVNGAGTADVGVAKTVSEPTPAVGESITFVVGVTNHGPETATGVVVDDTIPPGFTITSSVTSSGTFDAPTHLWTLGPLLPSQSAVLILTGTIDQPGMFTNVATKTMQDQPDPDPGNDTGSATGNAGLVANLVITKTDGLTTAFAGQVITYTITVSNLGPSPVTGARVTDTFPADLIAVTWTCVPAQGSTCQSTQGAGAIDALVDLPAGGSAVFSASGALRPDVATAVVNTAIVTEPPNVQDPDPSNNTSTDTTQVTLQANLQIVKTGPATVVSGTTVTYTLTVSNLGPSTAVDVVVNDPTPAGLSSPVVSPPCAGGFPCKLGTLEPGGRRRVITVTYTVTATSGTVTNTATVMSPIPDPNPGQNTSTIVTTVTPAPTTTTTATTTSTSSSNPGSTTTVATSSTTTTTGNEICGNCADDDGDGLVDQADPDCCTEIGTLSVTRVRIVPRRHRRGDAKLRVTGTLAGAGFPNIDPRQQEVALLFADGVSTPVCCTITQERWLRLFKNYYGFWDKLERVCPPIQDVSLRQKRDGSAGVVISTPHFDLAQLTGNDLALTVRVGASCAGTTVPLRRTKAGGYVYP